MIKSVGWGKVVIEDELAGLHLLFLVLGKSLKRVFGLFELLTSCAGDFRVVGLDLVQEGFGPLGDFVIGCRFFEFELLANGMKHILQGCL